MWFSKSHFTRHKNILLDDLHGFVLPHAGTKYTGNILSHTLRFKPTKRFKKILIMYYPSNKSENVLSGGKKYYHEYYVVWKTMALALSWWGIRHAVEFIGVNVNSVRRVPDLSVDDTLFVISADFSHYLSLQKAIPIENCAAHSLMQREFNHRCARVIDDAKTFKAFDRAYLEDWACDFQWVGRTRSSPGFEGVGYLSFLLREIPDPATGETPDGYFITAYDNRMKQRECLGKWFAGGGGGGGWTQRGETAFLKKVLHAAATTSRLTGGHGLGAPITNYTINYLYRERPGQSFIRGWHGISYGAFYLPDVMLENTFNNGEWISPDDVSWPAGDVFDMTETLEKLKEKSGGEDGGDSGDGRKIVLYRTKVLHEHV